MSNAIHIRNLKPENIKKDVEILKVKGTYEGGGGPGQPVNDDITVNPSTNTQEFSAPEGYTGLGTVTVNPYVLDTKTVNSSTYSQTINSSADGMNSVTVKPYILDSKTVSPAVTSQTVNSSADGLSSVTVNAVTSSIDANITAENIKDGVTILGVTGSYNGVGEDWVAAAKNTDGASFVTDGEGLLDTDYGMYYLFYGANINSATFTNTTMKGSYTLDHAFYRNYTTINSLYFPNLTSITGVYAMNYMLESGFNSLKNFDLSFPELVTISGDSVMSNAFVQVPINSFNLPKLESIAGEQVFSDTLRFSSCKSVSMPNVKYCSGNDGYYTTFNDFLFNSSVNTLTSSPEVFKTSRANDSRFWNGAVTDFTLNIPDGYTYLSGHKYSTTYINLAHVLSSTVQDSVFLHILQQLGNVSDYNQVKYTVCFPSKSIQDNLNFDYTTAKNKLTDAGWTITGLTITAPDFITITTKMTLNLQVDNIIGLDAVYPWTATVDDPSIHLSSTSGPAGNNQTITVTMDSGWNSTAHVTLSSTNGTYTQTKTVNVINSNASYIQLEYAEVPTNLTGFALGTSIGVDDDVVFKFRARESNGNTMLGYVANAGTDYKSYTWRVFYYSDCLYWDCGGESVGMGRLYINGNAFRFDKNITRNILFKRSNNSFMVKNLDMNEQYSTTRSSTFIGTPSAIGVNGVGDDNPGGENHYFYELTVYPDGYQDGAGTPSAHYIPVKDSNDVTCIYDTVSYNFYYPSSGSLIPGPVIS